MGSTAGWWIAGSVVIVLLAVGALVLVVPSLVFRVAIPKLRARIEAAFPAGVRFEDLRALSFGLTSRGVTQGRGNGALVLTESELAWLQLVPASSDVRIPLAAITEVKTVRGHLGKTVGRELLFVGFTHAGSADSLAVLVTDLPGWLTRLKG